MVIDPIERGDIRPGPLDHHSSDDTLRRYPVRRSFIGKCNYPRSRANDVMVCIRENLTEMQRLSD